MKSINKAVIAAFVTLIALLGTNAGWFEMPTDVQASLVDFVWWIVKLVGGGVVGGYAVWRVPNIQKGG